MPRRSPDEPVVIEAVNTLGRDEEALSRSFFAKLLRLVSRLPFAEELLAAWYCAFDRATPTHVKATLVGAIAYFVLPLDVVPDLVPLMGFTDDAAVLALAIRSIAAHMTDSHRAAARHKLDELKAAAEA
jgi:uncharacterized membrane protein YkvA (DUF1232 family)